MASELKIGRASFFGSRSNASSSFDRRRPNSVRRICSQARPDAVVGADAAALAVSMPGPV